MSPQALGQTILTREAHFWSRSRQARWHKGEHSGFTQRVGRTLVDDDQDAVILHVHIEGPGSCHVGFRSCFYREVNLPWDGATGAAALRQIESRTVFDPDKIYGGLPNPTKL